MHIKDHTNTYTQTKILSPHFLSAPQLIYLPHKHIFTPLSQHTPHTPHTHIDTPHVVCVYNMYVHKYSLFSKQKLLLFLIETKLTQSIHIAAVYSHSCNLGNILKQLQFGSFIMTSHAE